MTKPKECIYLRQNADGDYLYGDCHYALLWKSTWDIEHLLNLIFGRLPLPIGGWSRLNACDCKISTNLLNEVNNVE